MTGWRARLTTTAATLLALAACAGDSGGAPSARAARSRVPVELDSPTPVDETPTPVPADSPASATAGRRTTARVDSYTSTICRGLLVWLRSVGQSARRMDRANERASHPGQARHAIVQFLSDATAATHDFRRMLGDVDAERVADLSTRHRLLVQTVDETRRGLGFALARAFRLPVTYPAAFERAANRLLRSARARIRTVTAVFFTDPYSASPLAASFERVETCQPLEDVVSD